MPILEVFEGLGRTAAFEQKLRLATEDVRTACGRVYVSTSSHLRSSEARRIDALIARTQRLIAAIDGIRFGPPEVLPLKRLRTRASDLGKASYDLADLVRPRRKASPSASAPVQDAPEHSSKEALAGHLQGLWRSLSDLGELCASDAARAAEEGALLITGEPGRGKTHLLCDVAEHRGNHLVTILLMGQHFDSREPIWRQIGRMINVPEWDSTQILDRLEDRARRSGQRALILIDALNEGGGVTLWQSRLPRFLAQLRQRRWLALAVTCRSSYEAVVLPRRLPSSLIRVEHEGFALVEDEALRQFFAFYKLPLPRVPLLRPEYRVPLFLKLFCAALAEGKVKLPTLGQEGINHLYEQFCKGVGAKIARDLGNPALKMLPWQAAKALAKDMAQQTAESLPRPRADDLLAIVCGTKVAPHAVYRAMVAEGLLAEDIERHDSASVAIVRFPYQHFTHHLVARYLLSAHLDKSNPRASFAPKTPLGDLVTDERTAWRHAGVIEALAIQLPERVPLELADAVGKRATAAVYQAALASIVWRKVSAFPQVDRMVVHINKAIQHRGIGGGAALEAIVSVSVVPGHPFGAEFLHRNLLRRRLPVRDATWTIWMTGQWHVGSVIDRLIAWVEHQGSLDQLTDDDIRPLAILTTWLFTSPNRFLRDRATKVLVRLLRERFALIVELLAAFETVDDPYVLERLYTAAYGCAILSDRVAVLALAKHVYERFFPVEGPPSSHMLLRDAARGIIERALHLDTTAEFDPIRFRPPYKSPWPLRASSDAALDARYGDDGRSITMSLHSMGDFNRYVLQHALSDMSRRPIGRSRSSRQAPRQPRDDRFDYKILRRWVLARVLQLGWTATRFKHFDDRVRDHNRSARKAERIGKKYQWIALHEGLGRIADHVWMCDGWGERARYRVCDGSWDLNIRDIDPSLLVAVRPPKEMAQTWWQPFPVDLPPARGCTHQQWIEGRSVPDVRRLMQPRDASGVDWLTLEAHYDWGDPRTPGYRLNEPPSRHVWLQIFASLVPLDELQAAIEGAHSTVEDPATSLNLREVFLREIGWHPSYRRLERLWEHDEMLDPLLARPAEIYHSQSDFDASFEEGIDGYVPSGPLRASLALVPRREPFSFGEPRTAIDPSWDAPGPSTLLLKSEAAAQLAASGKTLIWTVRGEKHIVYGVDAPRHWKSFGGIFWLQNGEILGRLTQRLERISDARRHRAAAKQTALRVSGDRARRHRARLARQTRRADSHS